MKLAKVWKLWMALAVFALSGCTSPQPTVAPTAPNELPVKVQQATTAVPTAQPTLSSLSEVSPSEKVMLVGSGDVELKAYVGVEPPTDWEIWPEVQDSNFWFLSLQTEDRSSLPNFYVERITYSANSYATELFPMDTAGATEILYQITPQQLPMPQGNYCLIKADPQENGSRIYWCFRLPNAEAQAGVNKQWSIPVADGGQIAPRNDGRSFVIVRRKTIVMLSPEGEIENSIDFSNGCMSFHVSANNDLLCVGSDGILNKVTYEGEVSRIDVGFTGGTDPGLININDMVVRQEWRSEGGQTEQVVLYYDVTGKVANQVKVREGCVRDTFIIGAILCVKDGLLTAYDPNGQLFYEGDPQPVDLTQKYLYNFTPWGDLYLMQEKKDALGNPGEKVYLRLRNNQVEVLERYPFESFQGKPPFEGDQQMQEFRYMPDTGKIYATLNSRLLVEVDRDLYILATIELPDDIARGQLTSDGSIFYMDLQNRTLTKYVIR
jgi:hypothetical protein